MANFFFSDVNNWPLSARDSSFIVLLKYGVGGTIAVPTKSPELPQSLPDSTQKPYDLSEENRDCEHQRAGRAVFGD